MAAYHPGPIVVKQGFEALSMEARGALFTAWAALWANGQITREDVDAPPPIVSELVEGGWLVAMDDGYALPEMKDRAREMHRIRQRRYEARVAAGATGARCADGGVSGHLLVEEETDTRNHDAVGSLRDNESVSSPDATVSDESVTSPSLFPPHPLSLSPEKVTNSFPQPGAKNRPPLSPPYSPPALSPRRDDGTVEESVGVATAPSQPERDRGTLTFAERMAEIAGDKPWFQEWMERRRLRGDADVSSQPARAPMEWRRCRREADTRDQSAPAPRTGGATSDSGASRQSASSEPSDASRSAPPLTPPQPVGIPSPRTRGGAARRATPSPTGSSPREVTLLTREQLDAWRRFEASSPRPEEWRMVQEAWLGRGLRYPPSQRQREVLWPILDARPNDTARWIREAPSRQSYALVGHVLGRWRAFLREVA